MFWYWLGLIFLVIGFLALSLILLSRTQTQVGLQDNLLDCPTIKSWIKKKRRSKNRRFEQLLTDEEVLRRTAELLSLDTNVQWFFQYDGSLEHSSKSLLPLGIGWSITSKPQVKENQKKSLMREKRWLDLVTVIQEGLGPVIIDYTNKLVNQRKKEIHHFIDHNETERYSQNMFGFVKLNKNVPGVYLTRDNALNLLSKEWPQIKEKIIKDK